MTNERKAPGDRPEEEQLIGPSGGPPDEKERQSRGSTPTEDVLERWIEEGETKRKPGESNPAEEHASRS